MYRSRAYRYANEQVVLVLTLLLVLAVIIFTSTVTFCLSGVFIIAMFVLSALLIRSHHQALMRSAFRVDRARSPELADLVTQCGLKLQPGPVDVFVVNQKQLNAYTFGISSPKVLALYQPLLKVMNARELSFIIGHEMGHVALGHTWLNTILGGMAGIPVSFGAAVLLYTAFRWWNRMCEYSADRAGLLACGDLNVAVSALVKLVKPEIRDQRDFERALALVDAEDDSAANRLAEAFQSHPLVIRRINALRDYARTPEYQALQAGMNRNLGGRSQASPPPTGVIHLKSESAAPQERPPDLPPEERWPWLKRQ
ncbi:MAG: M48 family metallopeptidase [Brevefilum sp.]|nr:M48 family metallopeptidase [Brevefilum sp.]